MVYGANVATCCICGRPYITGDCIELDGTCDNYKCLKELDIRNSRKEIKPEVVETCKKCQEGEPKWKCPRCEYGVCQSCYEMNEGLCLYCAPAFEKIEEKK